MELHRTLIRDVRALRQLCGAIGDGATLDHCVLVSPADKTPAAPMLELVQRLTRLRVTTSETVDETSQIHVPSHVPGVSVMFPIPEGRKGGVMKNIQDNVRGLQKKLAMSEKKLASIERNLANPMFMQRASPEVREREKNDRETVRENCDVLRKNVAELLEIIQENASSVCFSKFPRVTGHAHFPALKGNKLVCCYAIDIP